MRKIIIGEYDASTVLEKDVNENCPIFVKENGILRGMVVKENDSWRARLGGSSGLDGYHTTRQGCIISGMRSGYEFYTQ